MTTRVLMVCLGNICRSPAAEEVLQRMGEAQGLDLQVDSCGLGDWHKGSLPDPRMQRAAAARGFDLKTHAFAFERAFFDTYDYILAADLSVLAELHKRAEAPQERDKVEPMTAYANRCRGQDVPDPYHGTDADFEHALDMIEDACAGFIRHVQASL